MVSFSFIQTIDIFLISGGYSGRSAREWCAEDLPHCYKWPNIGGNGGQANTKTNIDVTKNSTATAVIGAGGDGRKSFNAATNEYDAYLWSIEGGSSTIKIGSKTYDSKGSGSYETGVGGADGASSTCTEAHATEGCSFEGGVSEDTAGVYAFGSSESLYRSGAKYGNGGASGNANTGNGGAKGEHNGKSGIIILRNH